MYLIINIILSCVTPVFMGIIMIYQKKIINNTEYYLRPILCKFINIRKLYIIEYKKRYDGYSNIVNEINIKKSDNSLLILLAIKLYISNKLDQKNIYTYKIDCHTTTGCTKDSIMQYLFIPTEELYINNMWFEYIYNTQNTDEIILKIYSYIHSINDIENFIIQCVDNYKKNIYLYNNSQVYSFDKKTTHNYNKIGFNQFNFISNKTFDNTFINEKNIIINLIDKIQNNKISKLGLLFYGLPGFGKTSLIKAIINYTKRHVILIKLSDIDNINILINILHNKNINNEIIPMNKRIYLLEDIDCDSEIINDRKINNNNNNTDNDINDIDDKKIIKITVIH